MKRMALLLAACVMVLGCITEAACAELNQLLEQVNKIYVVPNSWDYRILETQHPITLAAMIGHALKQQAYYTGHDPYSATCTERCSALCSEMEKLKGDVNVYFGAIAQACGYQDKNGNPVSVESLWAAAADGMGPQGDEIALRDFRVRNGDMPSILTADRLTDIHTGSTQGKLQDENAIQILGYDAKGNKYPANDESQAQPPKPSPIQPDDVCGTWVCEKRGSTLQIWREGDGYAGQISYTWQFDPREINAGSLSQWGPGEVCLRFRFQGTSEGYSMYADYKGKSYVWHPNGDHDWQDTELKLRKSYATGKFDLSVPDGAVFDKQ